MNINCCKDCNDRHVGCHSKCEKYLGERRALDEINERVRQQKDKFYNRPMGRTNGIEFPTRRTHRTR